MRPHREMINTLLGDVYAEGVFLVSRQPVPYAQAMDHRGLMEMNQSAALKYLLGHARARGVPVIFIQGGLKKVLEGMYAHGLVVVAGPGKFMDQLQQARGVRA